MPPTTPGSPAFNETLKNFSKYGLSPGLRAHVTKIYVRENVRVASAFVAALPEGLLSVSLAVHTKHLGLSLAAALLTPFVERPEV
jgi:hypothetical protein